MTLRRVDPTAPRSALYRAYAWLIGTRVMGWSSAKVGWHVDPWLLRVTRGRVGLAGPVPTVLLETTGARTGLPRRHGVIYFHDGPGDVIVIASHGGRPNHPAWYHNAKAHPQVRVNDEPYTATEVVDEAERERLFTLADRVFPAYKRYRAATTRRIPMLRLTPTSA